MDLPVYLDAGLLAEPEGLLLMFEAPEVTLACDLVSDDGRLVIDEVVLDVDVRVVPMRVPPVLLPPRSALVPDAMLLLPVAALRPCHLSRPCSGLSFPG